MENATDDLARDKEYMLDLTERLIRDKHFYFNKDFALRIVESIRNSKLDDAMAIEATLTYYRFMMFCDTITSLDARADIDVKVAYLIEFEKDIKAGTLTNESDSIKCIKRITDDCMENALNPLDSYRESMKFYKEHPGVKF
jgi:hypothetical protein